MKIHVSLGLLSLSLWPKAIYVQAAVENIAKIAHPVHFAYFPVALELNDLWLKHWLLQYRTIRGKLARQQFTIL